jgi:hypothetical protein
MPTSVGVCFDAGAPKSEPKLSSDLLGASIRLIMKSGLCLYRPTLASPQKSALSGGQWQEVRYELPLLSGIAIAGS